MPNATINEQGLEEIKRFLATYHVAGADSLTLSQLEDWAYDAEQSYADTGVAAIALKPWDCVLGVAKELQLNESGINLEE